MGTPPNAPTCDNCKQPLSQENRAPVGTTPEATRYLPPDLQMHRKFHAATRVRMMSTAFPEPDHNGVLWHDEFNHYMVIVQTLVERGPMLLGELVKLMEEELDLTSQPVKDRIFNAHDFELINIDPPPAGRRKILSELPRPAGRWNAKWITLTTDTEQALAMLSEFERLAHKDAEERGLTLKHVVDPDIKIADWLEDAKRQFEEFVRVGEDELGRTPEFEFIDDA